MKLKLKRKKRRSILIVDDDIALAEQLYLALQQEFSKQCEVFMENGKISWKSVFDDIHPEIVILDLGLPPLENTPKIGMDILKYMLNSYARKVIVLTGQETKDAAIQAINNGAFDYLQKPAPLDMIINSIKRALLFLEMEDNAPKDRYIVIGHMDLSAGLEKIRNEVTLKIIHKAITMANGSVAKASQILKVSRSTLYYYIERLEASSKEDTEDNKNVIN